MLKSIIAKSLSALVPGLKDKIVFLHIPKCAGTSVSHAIAQRFPLASKKHIVNINALASLNAVRAMSERHPFENDYYEVLKFREHLLLYFMNQKNIVYIHGHFNFSNKAYEQFSNEYKFVTILRDPVKRWLSSYFYNSHKHQNVWKIDQDIVDYMNSERGLAQGHEYVKKLYGSTEKHIEYRDADVIAQSKQNLNRFCVVGCLEHLADFETRFYDRFGMKLKIPTKNQTPEPSSLKALQIDETVIGSIQEICRPDIEIYQHALENFIKISR